MRILITGGKGQLGTALQDAQADQDVLAPGHAELDITDRTAVQAALREFNPDVVIHAAAWTDTAACEADPERAVAINGIASGVVAEACREAGAAMVYISSNEIFDGEKRTSYVEGDEPNPINEYGRSKLEGERRTRAVLDRLYVVRTSWLYGPGRVSFPEKIVRAAKENGRLKLVTDEVASPTWTVDLARAIARLIQNPLYGTYHLTNGGSCSREEWGELILRSVGLGDIPIEPATQAEFGAPYRKPVFSALANINAARIGITLRPWQEAIESHIHENSVDPNVGSFSRTGLSHA